MHLTDREWWGLIHGMLLGTVFLLAFGGGLAGLYSYRSGLLTPEGVQERSPRLKLGTVGMAIAAWLTVATGTWIVYPWYREKIPTSPKSILTASAATANWHEFGMEWKEHVAWIAPLLATAVAFAVVYYGKDLVREPRVRRGLIAFFVAAFAIATAAGLMGALITKAAPVK
jgi:phosphoglycerol transferase MdoB-like AlkP superfamily enzyme